MTADLIRHIDDDFYLFEPLHDLSLALLKFRNKTSIQFLNGTRRFAFFNYLILENFVLSRALLYDLTTFYCENKNMNHTYVSLLIVLHLDKSTL